MTAAKPARHILAAIDFSSRTRRVLRIAGEPPSLMERDATFGRARQQRALFEAIEAEQARRGNL